jgi:hypothetical protein
MQHSTLALVINADKTPLRFLATSVILSDFFMTGTHVLGHGKYLYCVVPPEPLQLPNLCPGPSTEEAAGAAWTVQCWGLLSSAYSLCM